MAGERGLILLERFFVEKESLLPHSNLVGSELTEFSAFPAMNRLNLRVLADSEQFLFQKSIRYGQSYCGINEKGTGQDGEANVTPVLPGPQILMDIKKLPSALRR